MCGDYTQSGVTTGNPVTMQAFDIGSNTIGELVVVGAPGGSYWGTDVGDLFTHAIFTPQVSGVTNIGAVVWTWAEWILKHGAEAAIGWVLNYIATSLTTPSEQAQRDANSGPHAFNANQVVGSAVLYNYDGSTTTYYKYPDGSLWYDANKNGKPETHVWPVPDGTGATNWWLDSDMNGTPDTQLI